MSGGTSHSPVAEDDEYLLCTGGPAESMATSSTIPEADEEPRSSQQQEPEQASREPCPSDQWRRLGYQALPEIEPQEPEGSGAPPGVMQVPTTIGRTA